ncbi:MULTISPECIES: hypothetical protein [unclassified Bacillus (in: firmicutes)]|uniref:hypothetical protein n=1 Tax=unclassified Bacillus (in: firmicutes) TaxID=185979 RepID=UPI0020C88D47|nr:MULTISPECIES: hypothetical protein [unclassified Bacillus (in: firmicutes)]
MDAANHLGVAKGSETKTGLRLKLVIDYKVIVVFVGVVGIAVAAGFDNLSLFESMDLKIDWLVAVNFRNTLAFVACKVNSCSSAFERDFDMALRAEFAFQNIEIAVRHPFAAGYTQNERLV